MTTPSAPVLLYTKTGCPHCDAQRRALGVRAAAVREINLDARPEAIPELLKLTRGRRIVPVVVDDGRITIAPDGGSAF